MLSSLFGKKSDHPLGDIKSVQALLDDLPRNDAYKSVMDLAGWIESVSDNGDFKLDHQFAVLCLLDEAARPYARRLAYEYFTPHEINKFQEHRLWLALSNLSHHTSNAYYVLFKRYCSGERSGSTIKAHVPLLVARAVHALTGQLKYACARYNPIDKTIWADLAQLCQHAEQQQYLDVLLDLYPGASGNTTVKHELAHLLGWQGCGVGALRPVCIHLTERIIKQYCSSMDIGAQQDTDSLFGFDLLNPAAPVRVKLEGQRAGATGFPIAESNVSSAATAHPSIRFISMAAMQPKLEALIRVLEKNFVPEELNLGGTYDTEVVREAAQYLLDYLISPPSRRNPRRRTSGYMSVVYGFASLAENTCLGQGSFDQQALRWEIEDISLNGFRTALPAQGTDGVRIGSLLGVQPDGVQHWGAAIVRRLVRDATGELQVGAEMLANQVVCVTIEQSSAGDKGLEGAQTALWLYAKQVDLSGEVQLLMRADTFSGRYSLHTQLNGKSYLLIPSILQAKGIDYDLARFRAIVQEKDAE